MRVIYHPGRAVSPVEINGVLQHLEAQGHTVIEKRSITATLNVLHHGPGYYDVVVAHGDGFPALSGIATLVAIKADLRLRAAPVVVMDPTSTEANIVGKGGIFADETAGPRSMDHALEQVAAWQIGQ